MSALKTDFAGEKGDLFALALKTAVLTVLTFGIYRFWAKTRLRRWYWSAVRPGGVSLEYTGSPHEKLMGFLVAVIALAIYLTVFNLAGMFVAIRLAEGTPDILTYAIGAAPIALFPIIFIARYRSRRYVLSRTTWLGVRFGMDPGAWGYAWRACMYWVLTILSLGLLWPLKTFQLERYLTDRSWYGTAQFKQHGNPFMLYGLAVPFLVCIGLMVYAGYLLATAPPIETATLQDLEFIGWVGLSFIPLVPATIITGIYFRVASIRAMAELKELGDGMEFDLNPRTRKILKFYIFGNLLAGFLVSFVSPVILGLVVGFLYLIGQVDASTIFNPPPGLAGFMAILTWLTVFILYGVFKQAFITYPVTRHIAETLEVSEPMLLQGIRQRARDEAREAGGLSEALDVGAAF